jgi:beta-phosphoglucomutase-like phosphatase (HAD superfamily)
MGNRNERAHGTAAVNLQALDVDPAKSAVVTRDDVKYAKPDPDLFVAAAHRLGVPIEQTVAVGDSIWDMLAASMKIPPICCCISTKSPRGLSARIICVALARRLPLASIVKRE